MAVHIYAAGEASNSKSIHKVLIAERSGEAAAFVVVAVSADGTPGDRAKAVEWAGDSTAVAALFAEAVRRYRPGRLDIFVPWHEADLISTLGDIPGTTRKNAGTVHIVSPERLFRQLQPYLHSVGAAERVSVKELPDNRCSLTIGGGVRADLQTGETVSFLFDPDVPPAARVLREKLEGVFPIPFPYTGGLNFV